MTWRGVVAFISEAVDRCASDPRHPWTHNWPSPADFAAILDCNVEKVYRAIHHLAEQDVLVKGWVPRSRGEYASQWIPKIWQLAFPYPPDDRTIAAEIMRKALAGEWEPLPSRADLAAHFRVSRGRAARIVTDLADRQLAVKMWVNGRTRWCVVLPHERRTIDTSRLVAPRPRVAAATHAGQIADDIAARISSGAMASGQPISVKDTQQRYRVGRRPVSLAFDILLSRGLITFRRRRGKRFAVIAYPDTPTETATVTNDQEQRSSSWQPRRHRTRVMPPASGWTWRKVADAIVGHMDDALADPKHPWNRNWPNATDIADQLGTTQKTVLKAFHHLATTGLVHQARVPNRTEGYSYLWVPKRRTYPDRLTDRQICLEIVRRARAEGWEVLPSDVWLAAEFTVSKNTITKVKRRLAEQGLARRCRFQGYMRWRIISPAETRTPDQTSQVAPYLRVVDDVVRRIRDGEFRYQLPSGAVHELPFLSNVELVAQYGVSDFSAAKARRHLRQQGLIVPASHKNRHDTLASHLPVVQRTDPPPPRSQRKQSPVERNKRARQIADHLIKRTRSGEFRSKPFPRQDDIRRRYRAGEGNVVAALELLHAEGWITFTEIGGRKMPALSRQSVELTTAPVDGVATRATTSRTLGKRGREVADDLACRIRSGEFTTNRLPTLKCVQREYRIAPKTLASVLDVLHDDGLIKFAYRGGKRYVIVVDNERPS